MDKSAEKIYDVLIVGSGVAGSYAALQFPPETRVLMLAKYGTDISSSSLAQGGVAAVLNFDDDSFELHIEDTLIAGSRENNPDTLDILVREGPDDVRKLVEYGADFDRGADGSFDKTIEGGHSRRRILHHKDSTGAEMVRTLVSRVKESENIELRENSILCALEKAENGFRAELIVAGGYESVLCSYCILCTGGVGNVYKYTTNPKSSTGDGIRIASELGAEIKDLSYIQFHPTAFNLGASERFLVSEAVRGEGAYLLNHRRERFMHRYDPRLELAPRDVVSRSIILESYCTGSDDFYLDIRHEDAGFLKNRFPGIYKGCMAYGVDITKDLIPIFPCQHYLMGGVAVDADSRTSVERLYAAGECANTGVHGKNRLASNSLLESLVFSRRAAEDIIRRMRNSECGIQSIEFKERNYSGEPLPEGVADEVRAIMQEAYFVLPNEQAVRRGAVRLDEIVNSLKNGKYALTAEYCDTLSVAAAAQIILNEVNKGLGQKNLD